MYMVCGCVGVGKFVTMINNLHTEHVERSHYRMATPHAR